jgi:hypothetical protein
VVDDAEYKADDRGMDNLMHVTISLLSIPRSSSSCCCGGEDEDSK